jgi:hypothetical protein
MFPIRIPTIGRPRPSMADPSARKERLPPGYTGRSLRLDVQVVRPVITDEHILPRDQ